MIDVAASGPASLLDWDFIAAVRLRLNSQGASAVETLINQLYEKYELPPTRGGASPHRHQAALLINSLFCSFPGLELESVRRASMNTAKFLFILSALKLLVSMVTSDKILLSSTSRSEKPALTDSDYDSVWYMLGWLDSHAPPAGVQVKGVREEVSHCLKLDASYQLRKYASKCPICAKSVNVGSEV